MSMGPARRCDRHDGLPGMQSSAPCTCVTRHDLPSFRYTLPPNPDPDVWERTFGNGASLIWVAQGRTCIGTLQLIDGDWRFFPLTQLWEGDQA